MATKIVTKNSSTASAVPTASDLVQGELAVNVADKRLFTEDNAGAIVELGTNPSTIDINAGSIDGTAIGASSASTGAFTTLTASGEITANGGIALPDDGVLSLGTSDELTLKHHNSGYSHLINTTGTLYVDSDSVTFRDDDGSPSNVVISQTGIDITGTATMDAATVQTTGSTTAVLTLNNANGNGTLSQINLGYTADPDHGNISYTGDMIFTASAAERMRIDSSGNVGIGISIPNRKVVINDAADAYTLELRQDSAYNSGNQTGILFGAKYNVAGSNADVASIRGGKENTTDGDFGGKLAFYTRANGGSDTERARIDSSGRLGIGRTPSISNSKLEVGGADNVSLINVEASGVTGGMGIGSTGLQFFHGSSAKMHIDSSGNVGINQSNPTQKLHVSGNAIITGLTRIGDGTASSPSYQFFSDTDTGMYRASSNILGFSTGGAERMRIDSSGNVGVGTSSPQELIHAYSGSTSAAIRASGVGNNNSKVEIGYHETQGPYIKAGSSGITKLQVLVDNTSLAAEFRSNGDFYSNDGTVHSLSDSRVKKDIADLTDGLDLVKQLRPRTFKFNGKATTLDDDRTRYGFVADEVMAVASQYVSLETQTIDDVEVDDFKSLSTTKMIPMLVKAIQEQQTLIESLTTRIAALEE